MVESQPSKLLVAGSNPVSRSNDTNVGSVRTRDTGVRGRSPWNKGSKARPSSMARSESAGRAGSNPVSRSNDTNVGSVRTRDTGVRGRNAGTAPLETAAPVLRFSRFNRENEGAGETPFRFSHSNHEGPQLP